MTYENVSWNVADSSMLTEEQFINRGLLDGQYKKFGRVNEEKLLKEAYRQIKMLNGALLLPNKMKRIS